MAKKKAGRERAESDRRANRRLQGFPADNAARIA